MKKSLLAFIAYLFSSIACMAQGAWTQKADFGGIERNGAAGFSIGTKGYIGTGATGIFPNVVMLTDFWEWDQTTNTWTQKADFSGAARRNAFGFSIGAKGYIGTGDTLTDATGLKNDFWEYDPLSNTWTKKADLDLFGRHESVGFSIGTKGYAGTGDRGGTIKEMWEYDSGTNTWIQKANAGGNVRRAAAGFAINNKGYIGIGTGGVAPFTKDFWEYDPALNTWAQKADFAGAARKYATGFSIGTKGYITVGMDSNYFYTNQLWEYDPTLNSWSSKTAFPSTQRVNAVGFSISTKGYLGSGWDGTNKKDFWEYDPNGNGVNEIDLSNLISVYPNPTSGKINVQMSGSENVQMKSVEIFNAKGEMIYKSAAGSQQIKSIDISSQRNGIYFLKIKTEKGTITKKVVLNK